MAPSPDVVIEHEARVLFIRWWNARRLVRHQTGVKLHIAVNRCPFMQAVLFQDFNDASVGEMPRPDPRDNEVLIRVHRVQLSVTECKLYRGERIAHYEQIRRRLENPPTCMLGHEFMGEVTETGAAVEAISPGDRVYAPGKIACAECPYCRAGMANYCDNKTQIGYDIPGGLAEYVTLPAAPVRTLPDTVSDAEGAAMQPLASAVATVGAAGINAGGVVAVVGCGVMGYQCAQLAKHEGARRIFAIDIDPTKLEFAEERGLVSINATEESASEVIDEQTGGIGADIVFEAVGGNQTNGTEGNDPLAQAIRISRRGGRVVQVGHIIDQIAITPRAVQSKQVDWISPPPGVFHFGPTIDTGDLATELVAEGLVVIDDFITHELDGLDSFERMVEITLDKPAFDALGPAQLILT